MATVVAFAIQELVVTFAWEYRAISEGAMKNFAMKLKRFLQSEDGPTAVEYAVMLSLIIVVCISAVSAIGTNASSTFNSVSQQLGSAG